MSASGPLDSMFDFVQMLEWEMVLLDGRITDYKPAAAAAKRKVEAGRPKLPE
jgi:hypothetical protein